MTQPSIAIVALSWLVATLAQSPSRELARALAPGIQLVYRSGGVDTPWQVDSVEHDVTVGGRAGCVRLRLRTSPTQRAPDLRLHCSDGATMTNWDTTSKEHRPARPLREGRLEIPRAAGGVVRFDAEAPRADTITGIPLRIVPTTVTTTDASGRVIRRLRERFAIELATATYGIFEVPDSASAGGWRVEREFHLVSIRR